MKKIWTKICEVGSYISVGLILGVFVLLPLAGVVWLVRSILGMLGVI